MSDDEPPFVATPLLDPPPQGGRELSQKLRRGVGDDAAAGHIHHRYEPVEEGQHHVLAAALGRNFQEIAGTEILHRLYRTERLSVFRLHPQADEVRVIKSLFVERRQPFARHIKLGVGHPFGRGAIIDSLEARYEMIFYRPQRKDAKASRPCLILHRPERSQRERVVGEGIEPHFAAEPMGGADFGYADSLCHGLLISGVS